AGHAGSDHEIELERKSEPGLAEIDAEPRHLRQVRARILGVDHNRGGPIIALREQATQFAFRPFGKIANRAAHGEVGSENDELARRADTLLDWFCRRSGAKGGQAHHEEAEKSWPGHGKSLSKMARTRPAER